MNILFLMGVYPSWGGVEKVSSVLANELTCRGHKVLIASFEQLSPELAQSELHPDVSLFPLSLPVWSENNKRKLKQIIRDNEIDILINQWCVPFYVAKLCQTAIQGTSCRLVSVHHNLPSTNARIKNLEIKIDKKEYVALNHCKLSVVRLVSRLSLLYTYSRSDVFIVLSPSFVPILAKFIHASDTSKIRAIPNPITIENSLVNLQEKEREIIYVGRIEYNQKRTFRIIEIWEDLHPMFPDWKLTIVGDGPDRVDLENRINQTGLKNISIEGFQNPLPYYQRSSILLLTSEYEGFPLVLAESMSNGVIPVVLDSFSSAHDIINNQESGIIVSYPYSKKEFVEKLSVLMQNLEYRTNMAQEAIRSSSKFSLEHVIQYWETLFKDLLL